MRSWTGAVEIKQRENSRQQDAPNKTLGFNRTVIRRAEGSFERWAAIT